jgi:hypothetical protein
VELENESHAQVPETMEPLFVERVDVLPEKAHLAGGGIVKPAHHVQERRFARSGAAGNGHELALFHAE